MIPVELNGSTQSPGEIDMYRRLKDDPAAEDWIVIHSLSVADHVSQIEGEIDFVAIVPGKGVLCIEVKASHRIRRQDGVWYYGRKSKGQHGSPSPQQPQRHRITERERVAPSIPAAGRDEAMKESTKPARKNVTVRSGRRPHDVSEVSGLAIRKSVVVGIGGTGTSIVRDLRKRLVERYESMENVPMVQFLCLDTGPAFNPDEKDQAGARILNRMARLRKSETYTMTVSDREASELRAQYDARDYLSHDGTFVKKQITDIENGASAIRMRGRFAFVHHFQSIRAALHEKLQFLQGNELEPRLERLRGAGRPVPDLEDKVGGAGGITFYLLGSLYGGTGSGCFIDTAYLLRHLSGGAGNVVGYFTLPDPTNWEARRFHASAYASLVELNHFSHPDSTWVGRFPTEREPMSFSEPPFNFIYLQTSYNSAGSGRFLKPAEQIQLCGESLFMELDQSTGEKKLALRDNFDEFISSLDSRGAPQPYLSFGMSTIHCPHRPVLNHLACRLASRVAEDFIPSEEQRATVGLDVETRLRHENLMPEQLLSRIEHLEHNLETELEKWKVAHDDDAAVPVEHLAETPTRLREVLNKQLSRFDASGEDVSHWGAAARAMHENVYGDQRGRRAGLMRTEIIGTDSQPSKISEMVSRVARDEGMTRAQVWVEQLDLRLREWAERFRGDSEGEEESGQSRRCRHALDELKQIAGDSPLAVAMARAQYLQAARQQRSEFLEGAKDEVQKAARRTAEDLLAGIYDRLAHELSDIRRSIERLEGQMEIAIRGLRADAAAWGEAAAADRTLGISLAGHADLEELYGTLVNRSLVTAARKSFAEWHTTADLDEEEVIGSFLGKLSGASAEDLQASLFSACRSTLQSTVDQELVALQRFLDQHAYDADQPDTCAAGRAVQMCLDQAEPYVQFRQVKDFDGLGEDNHNRLTTVHGFDEGGPNINAFTSVVGAVQSNVEIRDASSPGQITFYREVGGFPLRTLDSVKQFETEYDYQVRQGCNQYRTPRHSRTDIKPDEWFPIDPPSAEDLEEARNALVDSDDVRTTVVPEDARFQIARNAHREGSCPHVPSDTRHHVPGNRVDLVEFTITAPLAVLPSDEFLLDVWAHRSQQRPDVIARAREIVGVDTDLKITTEGPHRIPRGTTLTVEVEVDQMSVRPPHKPLLWSGEIGRASFQVRVPADTAPGEYHGEAIIRTAGIETMRMFFRITVRDRRCEAAPLETELRRHRKAFASYARENLREVSYCLQGMEMQNPSLQVFVDVLELRPGDDWKKELAARIGDSDILYLFWSKHAAASKWVNWEWKRALKIHGPTGIDPVPLEPPKLAPPPIELDSKHFDARWQVFRQYGALWPQE